MLSYMLMLANFYFGARSHNRLRFLEEKKNKLIIYTTFIRYYKTPMRK
jgi:hypothetical protein